MTQPEFMVCEDDCRTNLLRKLVAERTENGENMGGLFRDQAEVAYWLIEQGRHDEASLVDDIGYFYFSGKHDGLVRIKVPGILHEVTLIDFAKCRDA